MLLVFLLTEEGTWPWVSGRGWRRLQQAQQNDFVLWFLGVKFEDQALKWDSPWGVGYPGLAYRMLLHFRCKHLGTYLDITADGMRQRLHHTNEIARVYESYLVHKWCNYWFHVHHLNT